MEVRVSRKLIESLLDNVEALQDLVGFYVRVYVGKKGNARVYSVAKIEGVTNNTRPYMIAGKPCCVELQLSNVNRTKKFRIDFISNQEFSKSEFELWLRGMKAAKLNLPSKDELQEGGDRLVALQGWTLDVDEPPSDEEEEDEGGASKSRERSTTIADVPKIPAAPDRPAPVPPKAQSTDQNELSTRASAFQKFKQLESKTQTETPSGKPAAAKKHYRSLSNVTDSSKGDQVPSAASNEPKPSADSSEQSLQEHRAKRRTYANIKTSSDFKRKIEMEKEKEQAAEREAQEVREHLRLARLRSEKDLQDSFDSIQDSPKNRLAEGNSRAKSSTAPDKEDVQQKRRDNEKLTPGEKNSAQKKPGASQPNAQPNTDEELSSPAVPVAKAAENQKPVAASDRPTEVATVKAGDGGMSGLTRPLTQSDESDVSETSEEDFDSEESDDSFDEVGDEDEPGPSYDVIDMEVYKTELLRKSEEEADGGKEQVGNASKPEPEQPTEAREEQPLGCPENSTVPAEDETKAEPVLLEDQKTKEHKFNKKVRVGSKLKQRELKQRQKEEKMKLKEQAREEKMKQKEQAKLEKAKAKEMKSKEASREEKPQTRKRSGSRLFRRKKDVDEIPQEENTGLTSVPATADSSVERKDRKAAKSRSSKGRSLSEDTKLGKNDTIGSDTSDSVTFDSPALERIMAAAAAAPKSRREDNSARFVVDKGILPRMLPSPVSRSHEREQARELEKEKKRHARELQELKAELDALMQKELKLQEKQSITQQKEDQRERDSMEKRQLMEKNKLQETHQGETKQQDKSFRGENKTQIKELQEELARRYKERQADLKKRIQTEYRKDKEMQKHLKEQLRLENELEQERELLQLKQQQQREEQRKRQEAINLRTHQRQRQQQDHQLQLLQLEKKHINQAQWLQQEHMSRLHNLEKESFERLSNLRTRQNSELTELETKLLQQQQQLEAVQIETAVATKQKQEMAEIGRRHKQEQKDLIIRCRQDSKNASDSKGDAKQRLDDAKTQQLQDHEEELKDLLDAQAAERTDANEEMENRHEMQTAGLELKQEQRERELKKQIKKEETTLKKKHKKETTQLNREFSDKTLEWETRSVDMQENILSSHEKEQFELQKRHQQEKGDLMQQHHNEQVETVNKQDKVLDSSPVGNDLKRQLQEAKDAMEKRHWEERLALENENKQEQAEIKKQTEEARTKATTLAVEFEDPEEARKMYIAKLAEDTGLDIALVEKTFNTIGTYNAAGSYNPNAKYASHYDQFKDIEQH